LVGLCHLRSLPWRGRSCTRRPQMSVDRRGYEWESRGSVLSYRTAVWDRARRGKH
jgi:hypothetical protein